MNEKGTKVVWILGSGFSQSLGGPMLKDLLAPRDQAELKAQADILDPVIPEEERARCAQIFERIPQAHNILALGSEQKLWTDAEHFLDTLEAANLEIRPDEEPSAGRVRILRCALMNLDHGIRFPRIGVERGARAADRGAVEPCFR